MRLGAQRAVKQALPVTARQPPLKFFVLKNRMLDAPIRHNPAAVTRDYHLGDTSKSSAAVASWPATCRPCSRGHCLPSRVPPPGFLLRDGYPARLPSAPCRRYPAAVRHCRTLPGTEGLSMRRQWEEA